MNTLISIIIPVYNVDKYVLTCLTSINKQLNDDIEVIIVNDGSTDNSEDIILKYIKDNKRYTYIKQQNSGLSSARNRGISIATGKYCLFVDSDDYINDNAINYLRHIIKRHSDSEIFIFRYVEYNDKTKKCKESPSFLYKIFTNPLDFYNKYVNIDGNWISAWSCMVNTKFIIDNELLFCNGIFHEDELWVMQIISNAQKLVTIDNLLYTYRVNRAGSIMSSITSKHLVDTIYICSRFAEIKNNNNKRIIEHRTRSDMLAVLLSASALQKEDKDVVSTAFKNTAWCLKNRHCYVLWCIYQLIGFNGCSSLFAVIKTLKQLKKGTIRILTFPKLVP